MYDYLRRIFRRASVVTVTNVYLVILAGGVVRCTGSGMGCPDWPRCFGRWVPPTEISQLPSNYVEKYSKGGHLTVEFNVYKTWTEYVNRLLGVLVGFSIFIVLLASIGFWKTKRSIFYYSLISFLLVGLQGWIGAKVVASNLKPAMISIHMLIALVIVGLLLKALALNSVDSQNNDNAVFPSFRIKWVSILVCFIVLVQILIGTRVRQAIDVQALTGNDRSVWIDNLGLILNIHIAGAYMVVLATLYLIFLLYKEKAQSFILWMLLICIVVEYGGGVFMYKFALPAYMQPVHLTCASLLFGLSFYLYSISKSSDQLQ